MTPDQALARAIQFRDALLKLEWDVGANYAMYQSAGWSSVFLEVREAREAAQRAVEACQRMLDRVDG